MKNTAILPLCLCFAVIFLQTASAQFPPYHIFTSANNGQTVQMTDSTVLDLICDCKGMEIWAINFTLDGAGYKLKGTAGGDHDYIGLAIKPQSLPSNVMVMNLEVTLWGHGIYGQNWSHGLLDSCWMHHNWRNGYQSGPTGGNNTEIEIRNSTFDSNDLDGIKISDAGHYYVHDNVITNNGHHRNIPETDLIPGGIEIFRNGGQHNRIENNYFEGNTNFGLRIYTWYNDAGTATGMPKHNLIRGNFFENNMVWVEESDSNTFISNQFNGTASTIKVVNCIGNVFIDNEFTGPWGGALDLTVEDAEVTFIGTSFEGATVNLSGISSALTVGWHVDATVTDEGSPVAGAIAQFYDKDEVLVATDTTNAEGKTDTLDLMAYVLSESSTENYTPYRFVVLRDDVEFYSSTFELTDNTHLTTTTTAVDDREAGELPTRFALKQNHPNPFNPQTTIAYTLDRSQDITLTVYTINGRLVRVLEVGYMQAGSHQVVWDGRDDNGTQVGSGVYIYRLRGERGDQLLKKAVFLK
jgi:hypothetical protein